MKIAILGAGGTGAMTGALLTKGGADVILVDPFAEHMEKIRTSGLYMEKNIGDPETVVMKTVYPAVDIEPVDMVIVLTKSMHTCTAIEQAPALFGEKTVVITFQNGLGNKENLLKYFPPENVGYGVMSLSGHIKGPGHIWAKLHPITRRAVYFKNVIRGAYDEKYEQLEKYFLAAGIGAKFDFDCDTDIWHKIMANCAGNLPCAITRLKTGQVADVPEGLELQKSIIYEVVQVANADGMNFDFEHEWHYYYNSMLPGVYNQYPSAALDVQNRRQTEADTLNGAIVKYGLKYGIQTPVNDTVYKIMTVIQESYDKQFS